MKKMTSRQMMPKILLALFVLSGVAVFAATNPIVSRALNFARPDVRVEMTGSVERDNKTVSLDKAETVKSGETIDWTIVSQNEGAGDAKNYRVVGQIPQGTTFVAGSGKGENAPQISYSIDGGKNFSAKPLIEEKQADGTIKQVAAPAAMFTQIRFEWAQSLSSQSKFAAAYRVRVK